MYWARVCCAQYFKDTIQKQFTTVEKTLNPCVWLCSILQRYNSKAIHNAVRWLSPARSVVLNTSKIQFKSNSQLHLLVRLKNNGCAQYFKDTIQKQFTTAIDTDKVVWGLCSILQRYNSKAIHNCSEKRNEPLTVVLNTSKIQFKSNSQRLCFCGHCF